MTNFEPGKLYYNVEWKRLCRLFEIDKENSPNWPYWVDLPDGNGTDQGNWSTAQLWGREEILEEIKDLEERIAHLKEMLTQVETE